MEDLKSEKKVKFDYQEEDIIQLKTTFEELSCEDKISPDSYIIIACDNGNMTIDINGVTEKLNTYEALILPPYTHICNFKASEDIRCDYCSIKVEIVEKLLQQHIDDWDCCIYLLKKNHITTTEDTFRHYIDILSFKISHQEQLYHREVIQATLQSILYEYLELMQEGSPKPKENTTEGQHLVLCKQFLRLLIKQHKHLSVETYAKELNVLGNYLIMVCRKVTGKTAHQWIQEYTKIHIQYYLLNTELSIKEICSEMGFPNPSFFSTYCHKALGCTPHEYRKKMKKK